MSANALVVSPKLSRTRLEHRTNVTLLYMVIYDLICDNSHDFEGWFKNVADFEQQQATGMLSCPFCESLSVTRKLTAPNVSRKSNSAPVKQEVAIGGSAEAYTKLQSMLGKMHEFIDNNFEDVGNRFAEEALNIHKGDREKQNIKGTASKEEIKQLADEGVTALPIPPKPIDKKKLN